MVSNKWLSPAKNDLLGEIWNFTSIKNFIKIHKQLFTEIQIYRTLKYTNLNYAKILNLHNSEKASISLIILKMLNNRPTLAIGSVDTAENGPSKIWPGGLPLPACPRLPLALTLGQTISYGNSPKTEIQSFRPSCPQGHRRPRGENHSPRQLRVCLHGPSVINQGPTESEGKFSFCYLPSPKFSIYWVFNLPLWFRNYIQRPPTISWISRNLDNFSNNTILFS